MPTPTPQLKLLKPTTADPFSTKDLADNWGKIDASPGAFICKSTSRPSWNTAQAGRTIRETDSGLEWMWDGAAFQRTGGQGILRTTSGALAYSMRTTTLTTTSNSPIMWLGVKNVVIPPGRRPLLLTCTWYNSFTNNSPRGYILGSFREGYGNGGGSGLNETFGIFAGWNSKGASGFGNMRQTVLYGGRAAGTYSYSMQFLTNATRPATASLTAATYGRAEFWVVEL